MPSAAQNMVANNVDNITVMATSSMTMYTLLVMHSWLGLWLRGIAPLVCVVASCVVKRKSEQYGAYFMTPLFQPTDAILQLGHLILESLATSGI